MDTPVIDNSADADLDSLVTWQYDNAPHLCGVADMLKEAFQKGVQEPWDRAFDDDWSEWFAGRIGSLIGVPRYQIKKPDDTYGQISLSNYVKILKAKLRLLASNGSLLSYWEFYDSVFGDLAKFTDNHDMTVTLSATSSSYSELLAILNSFGKTMVDLPTGVKFTGDDDYRIFTCTPANGTRQDDIVTNFNPAEGGSFYWE